MKLLFDENLSPKLPRLVAWFGAMRLENPRVQSRRDDRQ